MQFLISVVKQVSRIAVTFLDQNGWAKEKFLDLETEAREFLGSNKVPMQSKESCLRVKWVLNSHRTSFMQNQHQAGAVTRRTTELAGNGDEHEERG